MGPPSVIWPAWWRAPLLLVFSVRRVNRQALLQALRCRCWWPEATTAMDTTVALDISVLSTILAFKESDVIGVSRANYVRMLRAYSPRLLRNGARGGGELSKKIGKWKSINVYTYIHIYFETVYSLLSVPLSAWYPGLGGVGFGCGIIQ